VVYSIDIDNAAMLIDALFFTLLFEKKSKSEPSFHTLKLGFLNSLIVSLSMRLHIYRYNVIFRVVASLCYCGSQ